MLGLPPRFDAPHAAVPAARQARLPLRQHARTPAWADIDAARASFFRDASAAGPRRSRRSPAVTADSRKVRERLRLLRRAGRAGDGLRFARRRRRARRERRRRERAPAERSACRSSSYADVRLALAQAAAQILSAPAADRSPPSPAPAARRSVADFLRQIWLALRARRRRRSAPSASSRRAARVYGSLTTPDPITLHQTLDRARRATASRISRWRRPRTASTSAGSTACGCRSAPSPISRAIISIITRPRRLSRRQDCACSTRCCSRASRR